MASSHLDPPNILDPSRGRKRRAFSTKPFGWKCRRYAGDTQTTTRGLLRTHAAGRDDVRAAGGAPGPGTSGPPTWTRTLFRGDTPGGRSCGAAADLCPRGRYVV